MVFSDLETILPPIFFLVCKHRFKHWTLSDIQKYQQQKIQEMVEFAVNSSTFYKNYYKNANLKDFFSLPTINKQIMMDNFTDFNTLGLIKEEVVKFALEAEAKRDFSSRYKGLTIGMSSGTSGNKGIIITTSREEYYLKAMYFSRLVLPKERLNCAFVLRVSSTAFNFNFLGNSLTYINQLQPIEHIVSQLNQLRPNVISAPPSMLNIFADEVEKDQLKVNPKILYSYAEVLYPDVKERVMKVFGCQIHEIYQGSEGCHALTCREGNLHLNEDIVYFELQNQDGSPTVPGNPCYRLLVTDLHKHSQPIIRFELNDIITISPDKCPCGSLFRVIMSIQGRADQMFWGLSKATKSKQFIFPDYISRKIISISEDIVDFQVIQQSFMKITVRIKLKHDVPILAIANKIHDGIREIFTAYDCIEPEVEVREGNPIRNPRSNKLIRIFCNIK